MSQVRPNVAGTVQARILELDDVDAVRMLRLVLERQHRLPDPETARELARHLTEAAGRKLVLEYPAASADSSPGTRTLSLPEGVAPVTGGDLARETLLYLLAEQPELEPVLASAAEGATGPMGALTRPGYLDLGVQVLLILHEEVTLERDLNDAWRFRIHRKAMNDATLAGVLAKLVATVGGGPHL